MQAWYINILLLTIIVGTGMLKFNIGYTLSLLLALSPYTIKDQEGSSKYGSNSSDHANDDHLVESSLVY